MNQYQLLRKFNDKFKLKFNPEFFSKSEKEIVECLKEVILSSQRDKFFTIKVLSFREIYNYSEINNILYELEERSYKCKGKNKSKKKNNIYSYININNSSIFLLEVNYYAAVKGKSKEFKVYIAIPRLLDKYYFKINGNIYSAIYQIVDGSTYNANTSNSKYPCVTLKTLFMAIRVYRYTQVLKTVDEISVTCAFYRMNAFKKSIPAIKYIMAKYGWYEGINFLGGYDIVLSNHDLKDESKYTFLMSNKKIYVSVPKFLMDNDLMTQNLVYTIVSNTGITKDTEYTDLYTNDFWLCCLGAEFNNATINKGLSLLDSFEHIYDSITKKIIHLPYEYKQDSYHITRWILSEFLYLNNRDNLDLGFKRIRYGEYIASLYAIKLSHNIYDISDLGDKIELADIEKRIKIQPTYLLTSLVNCRLVNYKDFVGDLDSMIALKFSYKGIAGIGEKKSAQVPEIYKFVRISHMGRVDLDSSSESDPGMSGMLCPINELKENKYFTDYPEPNFWITEMSKLLTQYKKQKGLKEIFEFKSKFFMDKVDPVHMKELEEDIKSTELALDFAAISEEDNEINGYPLDGSGLLSYNMEEDLYD